MLTQLEREQRNRRAFDWYHANRERVCVDLRIRYAVSPEHRKRLAVLRREYYMRHWESEREARRCWKAANREKVRASNRKRKAIKKGCNSTAVSPDIVQRLWVKQDGLCNNLFCNADLIFEIRMYHLDHILPFALGGKHEDSNLQLLCASCNLLKGARHPASGWEFIRARSSANG